MKLFQQLQCNKHCFLSFLAVLLISSSSYAQTDVFDFSDFGNFKKEELDYKVCPFDKEADAVVFYDKAISNYDDEYSLITSRSIRFKILKEKGKERGNIRIYFHSGDDFEYIKDIDAVVLNYDDQGNMISNKIDRKSIFTTKANSVFSIVSFALPNVKAGSIIEYKYTSVCKHYGGLKDWKFQKDIPVLFSTYKLYVIPNHEFAYTVYKNSFMQTDVKTDPGVVTFAMKNIPGLRDEAYSTSYEDYIQRVTFQLSGYSNYMGTKKVNTTWKDLSKDLFEDPDFGGALNKDLSNTADLKANCDKLSSVEEKIKLIYNYVRSSMNWDHIYSLYCDNGIKSAWEKKKGHSADINLVLINLLKANGLDVYPLLVSEREDGKVDTTYPYLKQFMNVVAYVEAGGKSFILDGIDRITPTGTTPFKLLNTKGYIVDKKKGRFITITDNGLKDKNIINLLVNVDPSGNLSGQSAIYNFDYAKVYKVNAYNNIVDKYRDAYMEKYASMKIDSFQISGLDNDSLPLTESFLLTAPVNKSGDYYLLNYNLFTGLEKNPFVSEHRFTNIDFGCQHSTLLNAYFTIPANFDIESLPKSILLRTPDNSISMSRTIEKQERNIRLLIKMDIVKTEFQADEYDMIQGFYKKVFETLNEPIVLKSK